MWSFFNFCLKLGITVHDLIHISSMQANKMASLHWMIAAIVLYIHT